MKKMAIIGAGAFGMFVAANVKNREIVVLESGSGILKKVLASGGGRCNVCNSTSDLKKLLENYPRNGGRLRKLFLDFSPASVADWFESRGVALKEEENGRVFPKSDSSETVVRAIYESAKKNGAQIVEHFRVEEIILREDGEIKNFTLKSSDGKLVECDEVVIAIGGKWNDCGLKKSLESLGLNFVENSPSLFAFDVSDMSALAGVCVQDVSLWSPLLKRHSKGELLFTHTGISGPAVLKLSSFGSREFMRKNYEFRIFAEFLPAEEFENFISKSRAESSKKLVKNCRPQKIPQTLWDFLISRAGISGDIQFGRFGKAEEIRLKKCVCEMSLDVKGKSAHKGEFVTAGGIDVGDIDFTNMESKAVKGLYMGGECIDIDGLTGGFNLMACWVEGMRLAKNLH